MRICRVLRWKKHTQQHERKIRKDTLILILPSSLSKGHQPRRLLYLFIRASLVLVPRVIPRPQNGELLLNIISINSISN
jgi:hypothetical protein